MNISGYLKPAVSLFASSEPGATSLQTGKDSSGDTKLFWRVMDGSMVLLRGLLDLEVRHRILVPSYSCPSDILFL